MSFFLHLPFVQLSWVPNCCTETRTACRNSLKAKAGQLTVYSHGPKACGDALVMMITVICAGDGGPSEEQVRGGIGYCISSVRNDDT